MNKVHELHDQLVYLSGGDSDSFDSQEVNILPSHE